jgi:hypothetical protein
MSAGAAIGPEGLGKRYRIGGWVRDGDFEALAKRIAFGVQLLALALGLPGVYLRAAYYRASLDRCNWEVHVGLGSVLLRRGASLGARASMGGLCVIGHAPIGGGAMIGSRVSVPSGRRQHIDDTGRLSAWSGRFEPAAIVAVGAAVSTPVPAGALASGDPAPPA